ncbi:MAG: hypothetical protein Q7S57_01175 [bacterium]|nr:hypothetical protein [bacterium]
MKLRELYEIWPFLLLYIFIYGIPVLVGYFIISFMSEIMNFSSESVWLIAIIVTSLLLRKPLMEKFNRMVKKQVAEEVEPLKREISKINEQLSK